MIRSELVAKLAIKNPEITLADTEKVVRSVFDAITEKLAEGGRVELRGFGTFSIKHRDQWLARNPRTGDPVEVEAKVLPCFRAGKGLRDRLNAK